MLLDAGCDKGILMSEILDGHHLLRVSLVCDGTDNLL
jgi:hypothetical protein